jgi:hypothetical protein
MAYTVPKPWCCSSTIVENASHVLAQTDRRSLSPRGSGREAMTYDRGEAPARNVAARDGAIVSHLAELVRGD